MKKIKNVMRRKIQKGLMRLSFEEMHQRRMRINNAMDAMIDNCTTIGKEALRVFEVLENAEAIFDKLDTEFERKTDLTKTDIAFLFVAIGLQVARQYLVTCFPERLNDKDAANESIFHGEEHSDRELLLNYNPSFEEIVKNPVPFDAQFGSKDFDLGLGGTVHRSKTLGHDVILGWIFGTANIATSTITLNNFQSFHVITGHTKNGNKRDKIIDKANTFEVFQHVFLKILNYEGKWRKARLEEGIYKENNKLAGPAIIAAALAKEAIHLGTDINSKLSLPIPIISTISEDFAMELAEYGLDMANVVTVGKQITLSVLINYIIAVVHKLFYKGTNDQEEKLYKVRTAKILMYSNIIAASTNLGVVALTENLKKLDLGGIGVAICRTITDIDFIYKIKSEFVFGSFDEMIKGEELKLKKIDEEFNITN